MMMKLFKNKKGHNKNMHIFIGLIVLIVLLYFNATYNWFYAPLEYPFVLWYVIVGIIYAMLPDCDQPASIINRYVTVLLVALIIIAFNYEPFKQIGIVSAIVIGALRLIEHRKIIHSVFAALVVSAPLFYFGAVYAIIGFVTYLSHIVSDNDFSLGWERDWKLRK